MALTFTALPNGSQYTERLARLLVLFEGQRPRVEADSKGIATIGIGFNILTKDSLVYVLCWRRRK